MGVFQRPHGTSMKALISVETSSSSALKVKCSSHFFSNHPATKAALLSSWMKSEGSVKFL